MNYLAHAFFSNNNEGLLLGNFIADHLRGNDFSAYSPEVVAGITLHRRIDTFTDTHAEFKKSKRFFYNGFEKYSGILVDIYFDYFLAKNFARYSEISLDDFSEKVYKVYADHRSLLPAHSSRFLEYVLNNNIYVSYSKIEGIETVLSHLSHRIRHAVQLNRSLELFEKHRLELEANHEAFFRDALLEFGSA